jgi:polyisoprenoid-binding protein YceI
MTYNIDTQHSSAQFKVRHMMIANVKGEFDKLSGTVEFDPANASLSSVEAKIDVNSISTRETDRDNHLKSADFFDAAQFPEIAFKSKKVAASGGAYKVVGDLTIHGITKEVTLDVESVSDEVKDGWGFLRRGTSATTRIDRRDFGLVFNIPLDGGGFVVGDNIDITLDVEMTRKAD